MSIGGFKALVKIMDDQCSSGIEFGAGFDDHGKSMLSASMELEGRLYDVPNFSIKRDKSLYEVGIHIDFEGRQGIHYSSGHFANENKYVGLNKKYIGHIILVEDENIASDYEEKTWIHLYLKLPFNIFHLLSHMEGKEFVTETIHDLVITTDKLNPIKPRPEVALIKKIYFKYDIVDSSVKKRKWF